MVTSSGESLAEVTINNHPFMGEPSAPNLLGKEERDVVYVPTDLTYKAKCQTPPEDGKRGYGPALHIRVYCAGVGG